MTSSATAAVKLFDAVQSRDVVDLDQDELGSVRHVIEHWANEVPNGFEALPPDVVALRHAIADRSR